MTNFDNIKLPHIVEVKVIHYGYTGQNKPGDQARIWVCLSSTSIEEEWGGRLVLGSGYIPNPFPTDYFLTATGEFNSTPVPGVITELKVKEHLNGGRMNDKTYSSLAEYVADPMVKELVQRKAKTDIFDWPCGDPEHADLIVKFSLHPDTGFTQEFEVKKTIWDNIIPAEWYSEIHADVITWLQVLDVYDNAAEALAGTVPTPDFFGERLFPVIKAPKALADVMLEHASSFKGHSTPLFDNEHVYIGVRSKPHEISEITDIYASGGTILKGKQWDW